MKRRAGFTLIEIMVAVAILAILATLAISAYEGYITEARYGAAGKDLLQIQLILDDLASDGDLGSVEGSYTAGTEVDVYSADRGVVLEDLAATAAGAAEWPDPWGRPYLYVRDDLTEPEYRVFSQGPPDDNDPLCIGSKYNVCP
jgi:prepilin-type N-terminal cleavage/methylation domain-containing protein